MKTRNRLISAILFGLGVAALSANASAHDRYENHGWGHERYEHGYRGERFVEHRYVVREPRYYAPRYYAPVVYEHAVPVYREEPGVVVRIGLPPIIIPFH
ncbi:MAG: hypothetical protein JWN23_1670 [Rhodocyclales bacterium]|nr:hypothetical protein [Rhodocyclales bacterium]